VASPFWSTHCYSYNNCVAILQLSGQVRLNRSMSKTPDESYPRFAGTTFLLSIVVSFFWCDSWNEYLQQLFVDRVNWWFLKSVIKTAILMGSIMIPSAFGVILLKSEHSFLQLLGWVFLGIVFGIAVRVALPFVSVLNPYGI